MSLMCDGRLLARGWMKWVIWEERRSAGPSHPETIGLIEQFGLYTLGNSYKKEVRVFLGSSRKSMVVVFIMFWEYI